MANLTCTMPNCQTTAGCQCSRIAYQAAVDRVNRSTDREIDEATRAIQPITGFLDKPARVGNIVFRKGISVATVIEAAQRLYAATDPNDTMMANPPPAPKLRGGQP